MGKVAIPPQVEAALRKGDKAGAIERLRGITGLGLKEATQWVEAFERDGEPLPVPQYDHPPERNPDAPFTLPPHVIDDIARGSDSEAIRLIRKATGVGHEEAKAIVAEIRREMPKDRVASRGATASTGLAPGQVAPGASPAKWVALLVVAAVAVAAALYLR